MGELFQRDHPDGEHREHAQRWARLWWAGRGWARLCQAWHDRYGDRGGATI